MITRVQELEQRKIELVCIILSAQEEIKHCEYHGIPDNNAYQTAKHKLYLSESELAEVEQELHNIEEQTLTSESLQTEIDEELENVNGVNIRELLYSLADPNQEQNPEHAFEFITSYIKEKVVEVATTQTIISQSYKSELDSLQNVVSEVSKLRAELEEYDGANNEQANTIVQLKNEIDDLSAKRDAASLEIDELKQENDRLTEDNKVLRERIETLSINNSNHKGTSELAAHVKPKIKDIYNLRWEDELKKNKYLAILVETGEEITIPAFAIRAYKVLEGEELARFQEEAYSKHVEEHAQSVLEEVELQTPSIETTNADLQSDSTDGTLVHEAETVTRAEFEVVKKQLSEVRHHLGL